MIFNSGTGGSSKESVRYNADTDTVEIYHNGEWVEWKAGGMKNIDFLLLASTEWTQSDVDTFATNPIKMSTNNPQSGGQETQSITTRDTFDLDAYKYLNIKGTMYFGSNYSSITNGIRVECVGENTGTVTHLFTKSFTGNGSFDFEQIVSLPSFTEKQYIRFKGLFFGNGNCITTITNANLTKTV